MYNLPDICWYILNDIMSQHYLHIQRIFGLKALMPLSSLISLVKVRLALSLELEILHNISSALLRMVVGQIVVTIYLSKRVVDETERM